MSLTTIEKHKYMIHIPYASVSCSLVYAMVCISPIYHKLSQWLADTCIILARITGGSKVNSMVHQRYHRSWFNVREGFYR